MEVTFRALHPWALLPRKQKIDPEPKKEEAELMEEHFAWVRASRSPELCWPWRMSQEAGWVVESPVTVTMDAIEDVEAMCAPDKLRYVSMLANATENWNFNGADGRSERIHFTRNAGWIALYDFLVHGRPERMFFINGRGTVEWVLGWEAAIPAGYFLMFLPYEPIPNLEVLTGILDGKSLGKRVGHTNGFALAVRPTGPVKLERGQPFARILLLHPDSLRVRANVDGPAREAAPPPDAPKLVPA